MPVAKFDFVATGRTVKFNNLSTGADTYSWDFGDGSPASVDEHPEHVYAADNVYKVKLTASKPAKPDSTMEFSIVVSADNRVNLTIADMVNFEAPGAIDTTTIAFNQMVRMWQIYLQPHVDEPYTPVAVEDTFNQAKWPSVFNQLIAKLVMYDTVMGQNKVNSIQTSSGKGGLKKLEVGPSNAEWYDNAETFKQLTAEGGFIDNLTQEVCYVASMAGIMLPMCELYLNPHLFIVGRKDPPTQYIPWPISQG